MIERFGQIILLSILFIGHSAHSQYWSYVNPFIGTDAHGHTFPGPTYPFGMVQLSPDTRLTGWDGCSGYHFSDSIIYGFSHTHLSGTGVPDYCDILLMPGNGTAYFENGLNNQAGYSSKFKKKSEKAFAGYYEVFLEKPQVNVKLTSTLRTGLHEYTFLKNIQPWIIIDLQHRDQLLRGELDVISAKELNGFRISSSWAEEQHIYFSMRTSIPFYKTQWNKDSTKCILFFKRPKSGKILVQLAISPVDIKGAENNLQAEWINFNFEKALKQNQHAWEEMLSRIQVTSDNKRDQTIFYSALYHCLIHPNVYQDIDGRYRGMDNKIHTGDVHNPRYTVFSLWDTYRAAHPLYQLVYPDYNIQFATTMLGQFKESKRLPVWELAGNETFCMIGNHSIPVLVNAYLNSPDQFNKSEFISAIESTFDKGYSNIPSFLNGFISIHESGESVSKTIENSLDFYSYGLLFSGEKISAHKFDINASKYYKNMYNPHTGFFQAKWNHKFVTPFDPLEVNNHFTEANAWQYVFGAHHDVQGMMECFYPGAMGETENDIQLKRQMEFEKKLDLLFSTTSKMTGRVQSDITGLIGQYAHGNEPSHHVPYLYNFAGKPNKTQAMVSRICNELYSDQPDGLCGNEDCGQMSAWYVFSSLGFYPLNPVDTFFELGIPKWNEAKLLIPGKKPIRISSDKMQGNKYVSHTYLNGKPLGHQFKLNYGDHLNYTLTNIAADQRIDIIQDQHDKDDYNCLPFLKTGDRIFKDSTRIEFGIIDLKNQIEFRKKSTLNEIQKFQAPFYIQENDTISFRAYKLNSNGIRSGSTPWVDSYFSKHNKGQHLKLFTRYAPEYAAGGDEALLDGLEGSLDFYDGFWQGFRGTNIIAEVTLDSAKVLQSIRVGCLQDQKSWIMMPSVVKLYASLDDAPFELVATLDHSINPLDVNKRIHHFMYSKPLFCKKVRLQLIYPGHLPTGHPGAGEEAWIFVDEIKID
ncbi:MAG: GH92 family glycosyl hydrolase [Bacteroidota bacterium]|nr:GH92 family glycosyl hydrolase [Bacteroidota bacterium]